MPPTMPVASTNTTFGVEASASLIRTGIPAATNRLSASFARMPANPFVLVAPITLHIASNQRRDNQIQSRVLIERNGVKQRRNVAANRCWRCAGCSWLQSHHRVERVVMKAASTARTAAVRSSLARSCCPLRSNRTKQLFGDGNNCVAFRRHQRCAGQAQPANLLCRLFANGVAGYANAHRADGAANRHPFHSAIQQCIENSDRCQTVDAKPATTRRKSASSLPQLEPLPRPPAGTAVFNVSTTPPARSLSASLCSVCDGAAQHHVAGRST